MKTLVFAAHPKLRIQSVPICGYLSKYSLVISYINRGTISLEMIENSPSGLSLPYILPSSI